MRHAPIPSSSSTAVPAANQGQVGAGFKTSPASANSLSTSTRSASLYCLKTDLMPESIVSGNLNISDSLPPSFGLSVSNQVCSLTALTLVAPDSTRAIESPWSSFLVILKPAMSSLTSFLSGGMRPLPVACNSSVISSFSLSRRASSVCVNSSSATGRSGAVTGRASTICVAVVTGNSTGPE